MKITDLISKLEHFKSLNKEKIEIDIVLNNLEKIKEPEQLLIHSVSNQRELLIAFFMHFRNKGEQNIGMTIEQFVDDYLSNL